MQVFQRTVSQILKAFLKHHGSGVEPQAHSEYLISLFKLNRKHKIFYQLQWAGNSNNF